MPEFWVPGPAGPSLEDFVQRIHRQIERFASRRGWERAVVEVELQDGSRFALHSISPEPGYGYVTLCPYPEEGGRPWPRGGEIAPLPPEEVIVPVGAIVRITLGDSAGEHRSRLGFSLPASEESPR